MKLEIDELCNMCTLLRVQRFVFYVQLSLIHDKAEAVLLWMNKDGEERGLC